MAGDGNALEKRRGEIPWQIVPATFRQNIYTCSSVKVITLPRDGEDGSSILLYGTKNKITRHSITASAVDCLSSSWSSILHVGTNKKQYIPQ